MTKIYAIELENNNGNLLESFNTYEAYDEYVSDLAIEAYDSHDEINADELFNFKTWFVVFENNGDLRSLTPEQFKSQERI